MKRVRIIQTFRDRDNFAHVYNVGDVAAFSENRANRLLTLALAEDVKEPEVQTEAETQPVVSPVSYKGRRRHRN